MCEDRRRRYDDGFRREALEPIKAGAGKDTLARQRQIRLEGHTPGGVPEHVPRDLGLYPN